MITAKNYAAQAEAALKKYPEKLKQLNYTNWHIDAEIILKYADKIKNAMHFAIPDDGEIFDDNLKGISDIQVRLPYPLITVEYYVNKYEIKNDEAKIYSKKRLIIAEEVDINKCNQYFNKLFNNNDYNNIQNLINVFPNEKFIFITAVIEVDNEWVFNSLGFIMPLTWNYKPHDINLCIIKPIINEERKGAMVTGIPIKALPGFFDMQCELHQDKDIFYSLAHDIGGEVTGLLNFLEALSCSNVKTDNIQNENKFINIKRQKKGKLPLYETKVLCIEVPKTTQQFGMKYGDRRSPRQHLRRGHIRILPNTKRIWVNSCVVGSSDLGVIDKSYTVKTK